MTISHWQRTTRLGTLHADVVVIGAGICGISAALHLQRRGIAVRIVERGVIGSVGSGASARNAGFLMRGCADNYADAAKQYGRAKAAALWRLTERNLEGLRREGIDSLSVTQRVPSVLLALGEDELARLRESLTLMHEDGFAADWWDASTNAGDSTWKQLASKHPPLGALVNPYDGATNGVHVLRMLASKLLCPVHEQQEVVAIEEHGSGVCVHITDGEIIARHVLVCTNAYVPLLLPGFAGVVDPKRGQMLAIRPGVFQLGASYYANYGSEYFRQTWDGTVVVGGCRTYHAEREVGYEDRVTPWVQRDLEKFANRVLGEFDASHDITARWSGVMGFTQHHLPIITRCWGENAAATGNDKSEKVWFCGGFTGHGMSMAYEVSRLAVAEMLDGVESSFDLPS
jgi:glycine/D-amino acid oxidase-like deaminating enzyme